MRIRPAQEVHLRPIPFWDASKEQITQEMLHAHGSPRSFVGMNAHAIYLAEHDAEFRDVLTRAYCFCDGFGVHLLCLLQGLPRPKNRTTPTDFMWFVFERMSAEGKRAYFLGDEPGVAEKFAEMVNARHPGFVGGSHDGFFAAGSAAEAQVLAELAVLQPHLLCVGMGQPRQEKWAERIRDNLPCKVAFHIGASMAFAIGARKRGPRWATDHGLEWLFRVLSEPRRMFTRYFVEIPWLVVAALRARRK